MLLGRLSRLSRDLLILCACFTGPFTNGHCKGTILLYSTANSCTLNPDPCTLKLINNPNIMPGRDYSAHLSVTIMLRFSGVKTTSVDCCHAVVIKEILISYSHTCKPGSFYHKLCKLYNMFSLHLHQTQPFNYDLYRYIVEQHPVKLNSILYYVYL